MALVASPFCINVFAKLLVKRRAGRSWGIFMIDVVEYCDGYFKISSDLSSSLSLAKLTPDSEALAHHFCRPASFFKISFGSLTDDRGAAAFERAGQAVAYLTNKFSQRVWGLGCVCCASERVH